MEKTLSIIKPDATERNITGKIINKFEKAGLSIIGQKRIHLSKGEAERFYAVHKSKPFYDNLVNYMISGPIVVQVLMGENAVTLNREIMGATNPDDADEGTIRKEFALDIEKNSVHGSDSIENAKSEIAFFFKENELFEN